MTAFVTCTCFNIEISLGDPAGLVGGSYLTDSSTFDAATFPILSTATIE